MKEAGLELAKSYARDGYFDMINPVIKAYELDAGQVGDVIKALEAEMEREKQGKQQDIINVQAA